MISATCDHKYVVGSISDDEKKNLKKIYKGMGFSLEEGESLEDFLLRCMVKNSVDTWESGMKAFLEGKKSDFSGIIPVKNEKDEVYLTQIEGVIRGGYIDAEEEGMHLILDNENNGMVDLHLGVVGNMNASANATVDL